MSIKQRWIEALKSGKYKQGYGQLRSSDNAFCCLGVLYDVCKDELNLSWVEPDEELNYFCQTLSGNVFDTSYLPRGLLEEIGLPNSDVNTLIYMNDVNKRTLNEIADWIQEHLPQLEQE